MLDSQIGESAHVKKILFSRVDRQDKGAHFNT